MFNISFLWEPYYLSTDSVNQNSANIQTKFHIVAIFLIFNLHTIFHLRNYDVIHLENQFKMPSGNISLVVAIKAETKGHFHKFCILYYILNQNYPGKRTYFSKICYRMK